MHIATADAMIRCWRIARLSSDTGNLGYPKINILARCHLYGGRIGTVYTSSFLPMQAQEDADRVQDIVKQMSEEMRAVFEARHLALIKGSKYRQIPHVERARALDISKSTYWRRVDAATQYVSDWLGFDRWDSHGKIPPSLKLTSQSAHT